MAFQRTAAGLVAAALLSVSAAQAAYAAPSGAAPPQVRAASAAGGATPDDVVAGRPVHPMVPLAAHTVGGYPVKIDVLDRQGVAPSTANAPFAALVPLNGGDWLGARLVNGHAQGALKGGDYAVFAEVKTAEPAGRTSTTLVYLSKISITGDTSLVLDARKGRPVRVAVDRKDARPVDLDVLVTQNIGGTVQTTGVLQGTDSYVTPTGADSGLVYRVQARLTRNGVQTGSPYVYNLAATAKGIPANPVLSVRTKDLAVASTRYTAEGGKGCAGTHAGVDWGTGLVALSPAGVGALPTVRTEYFSPRFTWITSEEVTGSGCVFGRNDTDMNTRTEVFPLAGPYTREWNAAPFGPSAGWIHWQTGAEPALVMRMLSQPDATSSIAPYGHMTGTSVLRDAGGRVVATSDQPGSATDWTRPAPGRYQLTVDAVRTAPWSDLATRQHVVWNLDVTGAARVDLPTVRYRTRLDAHDRARAGAEQTMTLELDGMSAAAVGRAARLWVSYDDGRTWKQVTLRPHGNEWTVSIRNPRSGYVSLRATYAGVVDQTVIHAYGVD